MTTRVLLAGLFCLALASCSRESPTPAGDDTVISTRPEPVVVYAADEDSSRWPGVFAEFTRETGIRVTVRHRDAATIVNEVINDHGSPPADVLLTPSVHGAWKAADEGALRPLANGVIDERVAPPFRDSEGFWVAARVRLAVIAYVPAAVDVTGLDAYSSLGDERFRRQLCLTSSTLPLNRALIAQLIDAEGPRPAELAVRRWVANLALPPFKDDTALLAAIEDGTCKLGIVSSDSLPATGGPAIFVPANGFGDIDGVGIARHARQPAAAQQLIDWLVTLPTMSLNTMNAPQNIGRAAWQIEDAILLAARAGYR